MAAPNSLTQIITDAYAEINAYSINDSIPSEDTLYAKRVLNRMIQGWQNQGYHLWLKKTGFLFLRKGQNTYRLSSTSVDHATLDVGTNTEPRLTTLSADAVATDTSIVVTDSTFISDGDYIGIVLNDNDSFWTTVTTKVGTTINLNDVLPSDANSGQNVYSYTTKMANPLNIYSANRNEGGRDIWMFPLAYQEYFELPNKEQQSTPVNYMYDRQKDDGVIRLWQTPDRASLFIKLTLAERFDLFVVSSDKPDFPDNYNDALVLNLAYKLTGRIGKKASVNIQKLKNDADIALDLALEFDTEPASIYLQPEFRR